MRRAPLSERAAGITQALLAVVLFSTSPVLIRWAGGVSEVEITFWRLLLATLTVLAIGALTRRTPNLARLPQRTFALYGVVIALHFFLYIASLSFTSVAHSLALVYTAPLFIALLSWRVLGERLRPRQWAGVGLGVAGTTVISGFDPSVTPRMLIGDALAIGSAITFAIYSVTGRAQRERHTLFEYAAGVYGWGALWLLPVALWSARTSQYTPGAAAAILGLGVGPLGTGHTLYNAALRRVPATYANLIATLEVVGGVLLGALLLGELPSVVALIGAAIVLLGILLVVL
ncbi:MAG TPA: EamA family transporter [Chloroflexota bacterium]|nr:EamA family transporter [Chloroflexota bacterium]